MGYAEIHDGLHNAVATIEGWKAVLDFEPSTPAVSPFVYIILDSYRRPRAAAGITTMTYRFLVRAATPVTDSKAAELELIGLAMLIPHAVDTYPQFDGAIERGQANSPDGVTGWYPIGGIKCRVVDCYVEALDKSPYAGAITGG